MRYPLELFIVTVFGMSEPSAFWEAVLVLTEGDVDNCGSAVSTGCKSSLASAPLVSEKGAGSSVWASVVKHEKILCLHCSCIPVFGEICIVGVGNSVDYGRDGTDGWVSPPAYGIPVMSYGMPLGSLDDATVGSRYVHGGNASVPDYFSPLAIL